MNTFPSIDEVHDMLDKISEEIPVNFFKELNGGILLLDEHKLHPESKVINKLYTMAEYCKNITGRQIIVYYGSFKEVHQCITKEMLYEKLRHALLHEFTHHLESLAGDNDLEIEDAQNLARYKNSLRQSRVKACRKRNKDKI